MNNWHFKNENFIELCSFLKLEDVKAFNFTDFLEFDLILYFRYAVLGGRRYLLGEKDDDLPKARRKYKRMWALDKFVKLMFYGFIFYYIFIRQNFLSISTLFCGLIARC